MMDVIQAAEADRSRTQHKCFPGQLITIVKEVVKNQTITKWRETKLREIGLDFVFDMQMTMFDAELISWLSENFDAKTMSIQMMGGRVLRFTADDVSRIYGLPRGPQKVNVDKFPMKAKKKFRLAL
ncbi:unnamed protein product [Linum trigynum]|uniref:Uncharacterized protein n=1 Tax=Linum trigynum TaxID=586398 RepID=A0AAV2F8A5_9ROSI